MNRTRYFAGRSYNDAGDEVIYLRRDVINGEEDYTAFEGLVDVESGQLIDLERDAAPANIADASHIAQSRAVEVTRAHYEDAMGKGCWS